MEVTKCDSLWVRWNEDDGEILRNETYLLQGNGLLHMRPYCQYGIQQKSWDFQKVSIGECS